MSVFAMKQAKGKPQG